MYPNVPLNKETQMTRILAIDLGKFKSVACRSHESDANASFRTIETTPSAMHDLVTELKPDRLVIEVCGIAGWIHDLGVALEIPIEVANTQHEARR